MAQSLNRPAAQGELLKALAEADENVLAFAEGRRQQPYANGIQTFLPITRSNDELRADRRRAAHQLGLLNLERNCPSILVGNRRFKAWRVPGTPEFHEHAQIVAKLAEEFSRVAPQPLVASTHTTG